MIKIKIDDVFEIQSDKYQWILMQNNKPLGFYYDLESLVQALIKHKLLTSSAKSVNDLFEVLKVSINACNHALSPLRIRVEGENAYVRPYKLEGIENEERTD